MTCLLKLLFIKSFKNCILSTFFQDSGSCKYGNKCQFAHGMHELRGMSRHPKYKTDKCRTFYTTGLCPYGQRCHFVHTASSDSFGMESADSSFETSSGFRDLRDEGISGSQYLSLSCDPQLLLRQHLQQQSLQQQLPQIRQQQQPMTSRLMNNNSQLHYSNDNNNSSSCLNRNAVSTPTHVAHELAQQQPTGASRPPSSRYYTNDQQFTDMSSQSANQLEINQLISALSNILKFNSGDDKESTLSPPPGLSFPSLSNSPPPPHPHISYNFDSLDSSAAGSPNKSSGSSSSSDSDESLNPSPTTELYNVFGFVESQTPRNIDRDWMTCSAAGSMWSNYPLSNNMY